MSDTPLQLLGGDPTSIGDPAIFGVITVSDRASTGVYEDLSGPAILHFFQEAIQSTWEAKYVVIPDEQPLIEQTIKDMVGLLLLILQRQEPAAVAIPLARIEASSHSGGVMMLSKPVVKSY
eukprot:GHUV01027116.1.p1 GENE.GHUV01027116.1~~GHUV01027116.1.p1  ORF type:complete len:121 (+),score=23.60 GHUV01027116.1:174-536(+)